MPVILVQFDKQYYKGTSYLRRDVERVVLILPKNYPIHVGKYRIERYAYPLKFGWAFTVHKVQGMTLDQVVFTLDSSSRREIFAFAQVYVALSRVKSLNSIGLVGRIPTSQEINYNPSFRAAVLQELQQDMFGKYGYGGKRTRWIFHMGCIFECNE